MTHPSSCHEHLAGVEDPIALLQGVLTEGPAGIAVYAVDGRVVVRSQALMELLGADPAAVPDPAARDAFREIIERAFRGDASCAPVTWLPRPQRRPIAVELSAFPLRDRAGRVQHAAVWIRDVTAEIEREELRAELAQLERQNQRNRDASRRKSEFLANMSHELRTPLNGILGFAQILHDGEVDPAAPEHREFLGDILASSRHLLQILNDVLDLAKIEAGKIDLRPRPVDVAGLVAEVCGSLRSLAARKQIRIDVDVAKTLRDVHLDPGRFKQVIYNYLSNAIKFTPSGGRVFVRVVSDGEDALRVEVEDTGVGISPSDVARLFVDFEQGGSEMARQHGTGLGLALTRRIVEAQGGEVGVRSVQRQGSTFYAVLPRRGDLIEAGPTSDGDGLASIVLTPRG